MSNRGDSLNKNLNPILIKLSKDNNVSISQLREIVSLIFKFLRDIILKSKLSDISTFKIVRIKYFGMFRMNKRIYNNYKRKHEREKEN